MKRFICYSNIFVYAGALRFGNIPIVVTDRSTMNKSSPIALLLGTDGSTSSTQILDINQVKSVIRAFCLSSSSAPKHCNSVFALQVYGSDGLSPNGKVALSKVWSVKNRVWLIILSWCVCSQPSAVVLVLSPTSTSLCNETYVFHLELLLEYQCCHMGIGPFSLWWYYQQHIRLVQK